MPNIKITILLTPLFVLALFMGAAFSESSQTDGGRDSPVICIPSNSAFIIDSVFAFPGQDTVIVPVYFDPAGSDSLREFEFEMVIPDGLDYINATTIGAEWNGSINSYDTSSYLEVQGHGDTLDAGTTHIMVNLLFSLSESVSFDTSISLIFQPDVYFKIAGDDRAFNPVEENGAVSTYEDSFWVNINDNITAYSYQALDTSSSFKGGKYVQVPVYMYTSFPCSEFKIYSKFRFSVSDTNLVFAGYDTAHALYNAEAELENSLWVKIHNTDNPATINTPNSFKLITLYFRINDFHGAYNNSLSYDTLLQVAASYEADDYLQGAGSDYYFDLDSTNYFGGSILLPEYKVAFDLTDGTILSDSLASVTVKMKPSFWAQYYKTYVVFDSHQLDFDGITVAGGTAPDNVTIIYEDTISTLHVIGIEATSLGDDDYILPSTSVFTSIYTLNFEPTAYFWDNSGDTTRVYFSTCGDTSKVRDYFPPEASSDHVERKSTNGSPYFTSDTSRVILPFALVKAMDDVECDHDSATVPVQLEWIGGNDFEAVDFRSEAKGALNYRGIITGDFEIEWGVPWISLDKKEIRVMGTFKGGAVEEPGILLYLALATDNPDDKETSIILTRSLFEEPNTYAALENGSVGPCNAKEERRNVIPTTPATYQLDQNHPNPFNASTFIRFNLAKEDNVILDIYDILGRKVKRLLDDKLPSGPHQVAWDCTNESGMRVSSGFYIYMLSTDEITKSKKMLLLK